MDRLGKSLRQHPLTVALIAFVVGMICLVLPPLFSGILGECLHELFIGALMGVVLLIVGGPHALRPSLTGMSFAWRCSRYLIAIVALPLVLTCVLLVSSTDLGLSASPMSWLWSLAKAIPLALSVALFEETLFRGIVLSALVERFGRTRIGVWGSALIASLVFGLMHVLPSLLMQPASLALSLGTLILRLVVSTAVGLLLSAIYLRTHNLWCAIGVHAANDLLLFIPLFVLMDGLTSLNGGDALGVNPYASQELSEIASSLGGMGQETTSLLLLAATLMGALIVVAAYVPVILTAFRQLQAVNADDGSVFSCTWVARDPDDISDDALPPSPLAEQPADS